jgi:hypothetical protein
VREGCSMRVTLSASTADLDYIAGIIEKRTDRQGNRPRGPRAAGDS